jgi:hypothetical protein
MWIIAIVAIVVLTWAVFEYRLRKPDQFVLYEREGEIRLRSGAFYPRHFSLALPSATYQIELSLDGIAKGGLQIKTSLVAVVAPSRSHLAALIRVGGWRTDAVVKAAKEFETVIQAAVKEYTEARAIEELSSEALTAHLSKTLESAAPKFGLEVVTLAVRSIDAADPSIAEALRQRESARILEQTELLQQKARVAAARARLEAEQQIALSEHELELRKLELKEQELAREAALAQKRTEDELRRSRMRLAYEQEEMALLKNNPELLLLSPQAARLAEASQGLKNARTIVSLWPTDAELGSTLGRMFQRFLDLALEAGRKQLKADGDRDGS